MNGQLVEIDRSNYDHHDSVNYAYKSKLGLTEEIVREISEQKNEPEWMLDKRLKSFKIFQKLPLPNWGPSLKDLDLNNITYFQRADAKKNSKSWDEVPDEIKKTFEKLGIPEAERKALAGAGTQYESEVVYHNLKKEWEEKGVIFSDCDVALQENPELVKKYFMTSCVSPSLHKFAALHAAVWSGGTFIYVPPNVKVGMPLQAYFRMNAERGGQFEHTLIIVDKGAQVEYIEGCSAPQYTSNSLHAGCVEIHVLEGARARYSSIENWSRNTYNLNTKRALVQKNGFIEWINGNMGSRTTMLYPTSVLIGEGSKSDFIGVAFAGKGQNQDTGTKVYHLAKNTTSTIQSKSISKDGGITSYRGLLHIKKGAKNCKSHVVCDALMMDNISKSNTFPYMDVKEKDVELGHEATVGKISDEQVFYLRSRGLSEQTARQMIVSGFIEPVVKALPLEYAVELNRLVEMEMEGSLG
jgi:Fe-S cluster assembly protein SufB